MPPASCFRVNSAGNVVVDKRGGAFADDLYLVMSDNRNGTRASSNTDVFLFKSPDGGTTWIGPTRVKDDRSALTVDRECAPTDPGCLGDFGNDQWFPWADIGERGDLRAYASWTDARNGRSSKDQAGTQSGLRAGGCVRAAL